MTSLWSLFTEFQEMRRFQRLDRSERRLVFYAESESYWSYFEPFITRLVNQFDQHICYLTSSATDPVLDGHRPGINGFYIGAGTIRTLLFATIETRVMVMTMPDLNTYHLKRSKHPVHYVFLPHNMLSTHMVFRKGAHDAFDTVFCVGPHHVAELREAEDLYALPRRTLLENGYARLDVLRDQVRQRTARAGHKPSVLIAPSWPPHSLLEIVGAELIEVLLAADYSVAVRPHRDTERLAGPSLARLRDRFGDVPNFTLVEGERGRDAFFDAGLLITDWSGSALSFAFARERPVLFIDVPRKVLNPEYDRFTAIPLETTIRETIGAVLAPERIREAPAVVDQLLSQPDDMAARIRAVRDHTVYNVGHSAEHGAAFLADLVASTN